MSPVGSVTLVSVGCLWREHPAGLRRTCLNMYFLCKVAPKQTTYFLWCLKEEGAFSSCPGGNCIASDGKTVCQRPGQSLAKMLSRVIFESPNPK